MDLHPLIVYLPVHRHDLRARPPELDWLEVIGGDPGAARVDAPHMAEGVGGDARGQSRVGEEGEVGGLGDIDEDVVWFGKICGFFF